MRRSADGVCCVAIVGSDRLAVLGATVGVDAQRGGRALAIEDYYHVQTVASPQISPDGRWVIFTLSTRIEQDNSTRTEVHDRAGRRVRAPRRVLHYGRDVSDAVVDRGRAAALHGRSAALGDRSAANATSRARHRGRRARRARWRAPTAPGSRSRRTSRRRRPRSAYASEFERRHEERFKGVTFDWKDFQRDGQPFPAPNLRARPAAALLVQPAAGGSAKALVDLDLRPTNIAWHPDGGSLASSPPIPTGATS